MELRRDLIDRLVEWKNAPRHRPIVLHGARQIGKTWLMREFGLTCFEHTAYFNFDLTDELSREFEATKDPARLLNILQLYTPAPIIAGKTLLIFDEVQQCNRALNSLKYFAEQAPEYHVIAAGSLLGVSMAQGDAFPVGKVEIVRMFPLTFREFLRCAQPQVFEYLDGLDAPERLPERIYNIADETFRQYMVSGGMPAAASAMLDGRGTAWVDTELQNILGAYALDFGRHAPAAEVPRITAVWHSLPSQLARENRKFIYKLVRPGARAREYEDALLWLQQAGLIFRVFSSTRPGLPLSAYDDVSAFKLYMSDVGLLRCAAGLAPEVMWSQNPGYREFKGALAENAALQSLVTQFATVPRYWTSGGAAEVDFVVQTPLQVLPIEVKAADNTSGRSLSVYMGKYQPDLAIVLARQNISADGDVWHLPMFAADWVAKWVRRAAR